MADFKEQFTAQLGVLNMQDDQMGYITRRYLKLIDAVDAQHMKIYILFHILTFTITIGGVAVTAFVSIDRSDGSIHNAASTAITWIVWTLGFAMSLANACMFAFDIPNKSVMYKVIAEKMRAEGWCYLSGVGKYSGLRSQADRHAHFTARIERIQLKSLKVTQEIETAATLGDILSGGPGNRSSDNVVIIPDEVAKLT